MKSVLNAAARRNMEALKKQMGTEDLAQAAQAIRLRSADAPAPNGLKEAAAMPRALPPAQERSAAAGGEGAITASNLLARRVGDLLYVSGVVGMDAATKKMIMSYEDLSTHARQELRGLGFDAGQINIDMLEAAIVGQSWMALSCIRAIAAQHGATMSSVFKLVQYFRDLQHYPAYHRVQQLFCPAGVVSTAVEVSAMLPTSDALVTVEATVQLA